MFFASANAREFPDKATEQRPHQTQTEKCSGSRVAVFMIVTIAVGQMAIGFFGTFRRFALPGSRYMTPSSTVLRSYEGSKAFPSAAEHNYGVLRNGKSIPHMIEKIWIELYDSGRMELQDVESVQQFLLQATSKTLIPESQFSKLLLPSNISVASITEKDSPASVTLGGTTPASLVSSMNATGKNSTDKKTASSFSNSTVHEQKRYLCQQNLFAGNSNKLLSLARGKKMSNALGLNWALIGDHDWVLENLDPHPEIYLVPNGTQVNCVRNITGKKAYYYEFSNNREGNPFLPELTQFLLPKKEIRDMAARFVKEAYGNTRFVSVHRRARMACHKRATIDKYGKNVGGGQNCSKALMTEMCDLTYDMVQERFNPNNDTVVLFSDGGNTIADGTFPIIDDHDFAAQTWMMVLAEHHVAIPVSTVDLVVNHWRYAMGKPGIEPRSCYNDFKEEYINKELIAGAI